ncbi:MAG: VOC family protein [Roseibium sp.]|uniref:VOC family protein n=1 Tax=Roseibium sp. TaxID=1936156 RepID=UPI001B00A552|nr:VOC family protein [Roseibium sp.]MBO6893380.1 VOC family protein [Roseibium sp.]MBO6932480.1 VOC family protein [Roseibium sp.]
MSLPHLSELSLQVSDPEALADFYCEVLGMNRVGPTDAVTIGYPGENAGLRFRPGAREKVGAQASSARYWKIAITVPDLDMACALLRQTGLQVTEPHQFRDIAYMSHLADPEGHVIELLQHTFHGNPKTAAGNPELPLGGGARMGLITLRTSDLEADLAHCRDHLGMRYLSRQDVPDLNFCLHFLAFTNDTPPVADLDAVENRQWLWQRPYTMLEFQELKSAVQVEQVPTDVAKAVVGIRLETGHSIPLS